MSDTLELLEALLLAFYFVGTCSVICFVPPNKFREAERVWAIVGFGMFATTVALFFYLEHLRGL